MTYCDIKQYRKDHRPGIMSYSQVMLPSAPTPPLPPPPRAALFTIHIKWRKKGHLGAWRNCSEAYIDLRRSTNGFLIIYTLPPLDSFMHPSAAQFEIDFDTKHLRCIHFYSRFLDNPSDFVLSGFCRLRNETSNEYCILQKEDLGNSAKDYKHKLTFI